MRRTAIAALAALTLTGCGEPEPVTNVAPYCDDTNQTRCYDAATGFYIDNSGDQYGPGATVYRGVIGSAFVVPNRSTQ